MFVYFYGLPVVTVIMIDSSKTQNVGVDVQSPFVIERRGKVALAFEPYMTIEMKAVQ